MVVVNIKMPDKIFSKMGNKSNLSYEDIINYYEESSFEYEKVGKKAGDFKNYLINELSNG